ncbi:dihydrodipicolinate synthase family protein [Nonomuraea salmonea]|uniref:dihydrodipicolinate synthase family protein n=1 Tax=Nonomuraea salmonea TaxID=46181 RepID=UPI002FED031D
MAVKEFSGDVRRAYELAERAPGLDLLIGSDDVLLELAVAGAVGWIAGYPNMTPRATVELYRLAVAGDVAKALPIYRDLHPLLRWDSKTEFVQSIKLSMDLAGRKGGACRPPRVPPHRRPGRPDHPPDERGARQGLPLTAPHPEW